MNIFIVRNHKELLICFLVQNHFKACVRYFSLFLKAKTKINIARGLKTFLNDLKNYLTTYQGFKIHLVILKILGKFLYILNKRRIVSENTFLLNFKKV